MHITTLVGQIFKNSDSQFQEYFRTSDPEKLDIMHMRNVMIFFLSWKCTAIVNLFYYILLLETQ